MHPLADKVLVLVAGMALGGCTVADAKVVQERRLDVVDDAEPEQECGCKSDFWPLQGGDCNWALGDSEVTSQVLTQENCGEVQVPWCDAQFGCETVDTKCFCMPFVTEEGYIMPFGAGM